MDLKINNYQPSFNARMQLRGNISLLQKGEVESLKTIIGRIGSTPDIVDITLPHQLSESGTVRMAGYINGALEQFSGNFNNNDIYSGIIKGLDKIKEIFPMKQTESQSEKLNNDLTKEIMTKLFKDDQFKKEVKQLVSSECDTKSKDLDFVNSILNTIRDNKHFMDRSFTPLVLKGVTARVEQQKRMWGYCGCIMNCSIHTNKPY